MHDVKNILLFELQRECSDFSRSQLELFYQQMQLIISQRNDDSTTIRREGEALRAFVLNQRSQSAYSLFEESFIKNLKQVQAEYEYLHYNQNSQQNGCKTGPLESAASDNLKVALNMQTNLMKALEGYAKSYADELDNLNQRLSVICQTRISLENNLFAPITFAYAIQQTIAEANWASDVRQVAFQQFDSEFLQHLNDLYERLNSSLALQGILPNLKPFSQSDEQDRERLSQNQRRLMKEHSDVDFEKLKRRATDRLAVPTEAANEDIHDNHIYAIDYVGRLFREALSNEYISAELKSYLSRLYTPYVRLALADEHFVDNPEHAAHRVLTSLVNAAVMSESKADMLQKPALILHIKSIVKQLSANTDFKPRIFSDLAFRFSAELRHTDRLMTVKANRKVLGRAGLQQLDTLRINIQRIIESKVHSYPAQAPKPVEQFLLSTWSFFITSLYADPKTSDNAAQEAFSMVDQILSYARPSGVNTVPEFTDIAPSIREGFMRCGCEGTEVRQFLQQLMHLNKHPNTLQMAGHFSQAATE